MKKIFPGLFLIFTFLSSYSKDYDLIVFTNGDSVACRIDSVTNSDIYYTMRNRSYWVQTHIEISRISSYKYNAVKKNTVYFKPGTSLIIPYNEKPPVGFSVKGGIGFPEITHAGLRFQEAGYKIGIAVGGLPRIENETLFTISGDMYIPMGKKYILTKKQPWCARVGVSYFRDDTEKFRDTYWFLNLRSGKDIMFSRKLGMEFYFGVLVLLKYDHLEKEDTTFFLFDMSDFPVWPSGGISILYNFF